jgi:hypothetical protein
LERIKLDFQSATVRAKQCADERIEVLGKIQACKANGDDAQLKRLQSRLYALEAEESRLTRAKPVSGGGGVAVAVGQGLMRILKAVGAVGVTLIGFGLIFMLFFGPLVVYEFQMQAYRVTEVIAFFAFLIGVLALLIAIIPRARPAAVAPCCWPRTR